MQQQALVAAAGYYRILADASCHLRRAANLRFE
jgi:hypothetical protein